jgi:hypothetical protein
VPGPVIPSGRSRVSVPGGVLNVKRVAPASRLTDAQHLTVLTLRHSPAPPLVGASPSTSARGGLGPPNIVSVDMTDVLADHRQACDGFTVAVQAGAGHWDAPSPCTEWEAKGVLEPVIGFHDTLLLRPLEAKPSRPKDDPQARRALTVDALFEVLSRPGVLDEKRRSLLSVLTTDVLVHTWDLGKAVSVEVTLDPRLCQIGLERALANKEQFEGPDMFSPPGICRRRCGRAGPAAGLLRA